MDLTRPRGCLRETVQWRARQILRRCTTNR
jgi:hypothetical protein